MEIESYRVPDVAVSLPMERPVQDVDIILKVPREYAGAAVPAIEQAFERAMDVALLKAALDINIIFNANKMAQLVVANAIPTLELVEERTHRFKTIEKILSGSTFLTADTINDHQSVPKKNKHSVASDWKRCGRIFSVTGTDGKEHFPSYQFDLNYQPLPVVKEILTALGGIEDAWAIAAWFHFPNEWISKKESDEAVPVAPKDALRDRRHDVLLAAARESGTHFT